VLCVLPILNETHQLLVYVDDNNLLGKYINTLKKTTKALLEASEEIYLQVNAEKNEHKSTFHQ